MYIVVDKTWLYIAKVKPRVNIINSWLNNSGTSFDIPTGQKDVDFVDFWDFHKICFTENSITCKFMCIVQSSANVAS